MTLQHIIRMRALIKIGALIEIGALINKKHIRRGGGGALIVRRALNRIITAVFYVAVLTVKLSIEKKKETCGGNT